jgi:hypothetical protein
MDAIKVLKRKWALDEEWPVLYFLKKVNPEDKDISGLTTQTKIL